jgi:oligopeptide transport system ATP-binding protein
MASTTADEQLRFGPAREALSGAEQGTEGAAQPATKPLLKVTNLHTQFRLDYGVVKAVNGVSFDVRHGETVAIVGESGSGKSITAMSILRLIPSPPGEIAEGEIEFDGRDLLELSDDEIRHVRGNEIAMIFQEPMSSLNPVITIGRQLAEPLFIHKRVERKGLRQRCLDLLRQVRISDPEHRLQAYPHQFSGGMRQRAMIAMGLACTPRLIIADEPTTALDVTVQAQILELLKDLTREHGSSMILITHDLGVVARYADRINVMYAGRIIERGTAQEIFHEPKHPYTLGLMESIPRLDQEPGTPLKPIVGQPPDLSNLPSGCPFHPRCRFAVERCRQELPPLTQLTEEHWKACWIDVDAKA